MVIIYQSFKEDRFMKIISNKLTLAFTLLLVTPLIVKAMEEKKKNLNPIVYLFVTYEPHGMKDCLADGEALRSEFIRGIKAHIKESTQAVTKEVISPRPKFREFVIDQDYQRLSAQEQINLARTLYNDLLRYKRFDFTPVHIIVSNSSAYEVVAIAGQLFTDRTKLLQINLQNDIKQRGVSIRELSEAFMNQLNIDGTSTRAGKQSKNNGTISQTTHWHKTRALRRKNLNGIPMRIDDVNQIFDNIETEVTDGSDKNIDSDVGPFSLIEALHVVTDKTRTQFFQEVRPAYAHQNIGAVSFLTTAKTIDDGERIKQKLWKKSCELNHMLFWEYC